MRQAAEQAADAIREGILAGRFLLTSHDDVYAFNRDHGADVDAFLDHQLEIGLTA